MKALNFILAFLVLCLPVFAEETFYSSNEVGMALFRIPSYRTDEYEYVLGIDRKGLTETRRLIKDGKEIKREELLHNSNGKLSVKRVFEKGKLKEAEYYNSAGQIYRHEFYTNGELKKKEIVKYVKGKITKKFVYDSKGNVLYTDYYTLNKVGMLIKLVRKQRSSTISRTVLIGNDSGITDELTGYAGKTNIERYDIYGNVVETEEWNKDIKVMSKTIKRAPKTDKIESVLKNDYLQNTITMEQYDSNERLTYKRLKDKDGIVYEEWNTWDRDGRTVKIKRRSREKGDEEWDYFYGSKNTVVKEIYKFHGSIQKETLYPDSKHRIEKFYRRGVEFIRIYYEDGKKTREEIIKNGEVIRKRNLETQ